jgi:hypothetical protein
MHDDDDNWWARREIKKDKAAPGGFVPVGTDDICVSCKVAGAPQERPASGQPAGEPRTVDEAATYRSPAGRNRSLRNVHLCRVCGVEEVTGKTVGWEPIEQSSFAKYLAEALGNPYERRPVGTYELVGPKVNGNPENADGHELIRHDDAEVLADAPRDFDGLAMWLHAHDYEGIVWHGGPDGAMAKIKKRDFRS